MITSQALFVYLSDKIWEPVYKLFAHNATHYFDVCGPEFLRKQQEQIKHLQQVATTCQNHEQARHVEQMIQQVRQQDVLSFILNELQSKFQSFFTQQDNDFFENLDWLIQQVHAQFTSSSHTLDMLLTDLLHIYALDYFQVYHDSATSSLLLKQLDKEFKMTSSNFIRALFMSLSRLAFFRTELFDYSVENSLKIKHIAMFKKSADESIRQSFFQCLPWGQLHTLASSRERESKQQLDLVSIPSVHSHIHPVHPVPPVPTNDIPPPTFPTNSSSSLTLPPFSPMLSFLPSPPTSTATIPTTNTTNNDKQEADSWKQQFLKLQSESDKVLRLLQEKNTQESKWKQQFDLLQQQVSQLKQQAVSVPVPVPVLPVQVPKIPPPPVSSISWNASNSKSSLGSSASNSKSFIPQYSMVQMQEEEDELLPQDEVQEEEEEEEEEDKKRNPQDDKESTPEYDSNLNEMVAQLRKEEESVFQQIQAQNESDQVGEQSTNHVVVE